METSRDAIAILGNHRLLTSSEVELMETFVVLPSAGSFAASDFLGS